MASLFDVAVSDMRIPGYTGSYSSSYAMNDDVWWLRMSNSAFSYHAQLMQGAWPSPLCFDPNYNPDAYEIAWANEPPLNQTTWSTLNQWYHCSLGATYQKNHAPGWVDNTHVMAWGSEVWVKIRATGQWAKRVDENIMYGGWIDPNIWDWVAPDFNMYPQHSYVYPETGYRTWRLIYPANDNPYPYLAVHAWSSNFHIDPYDVAAVISLVKTSLVLHDQYGIDDRDSSRFLLGVGSDYYPDDRQRDDVPRCRLFEGKVRPRQVAELAVPRHAHHDRSRDERTRRLACRACRLVGGRRFGRRRRWRRWRWRWRWRWRFGQHDPRPDRWRVGASDRERCWRMGRFRRCEHACKHNSSSSRRKTLELRSCESSNPNRPPHGVRCT